MWTTSLGALVLMAALAVILLAVLIQEIWGEHQDTQLFVAAIRFLDEDDKTDFHRAIERGMAAGMRPLPEAGSRPGTYCPACWLVAEEEAPTRGYVLEWPEGELEFCAHHERTVIMAAMGTDPFKADKGAA